jgi:hypothetical protein
MKLKTHGRKITVCDICDTHLMHDCREAETVITITDDRHNKGEYVSPIKKHRKHLCDMCTASLESFILNKRFEMADSVLRGDYYEELSSRANKEAV